MEFLATCIQDANHRIDLLDSLACLLKRLAVLRILEATIEVSLRAGLCRCHAPERSRNVYVTHGRRFVAGSWVAGMYDRKAVPKRTR